MARATVLKIKGAAASPKGCESALVDRARVWKYPVWGMTSMCRAPELYASANQ